MSEILISGYYGFHNSGDDALLMSITDDIKKRKPDSKIVVLSKNPEETKKIYNVDAVSRTNIFDIIKHMIRARVLISGGGTLIQDATSTKSLIYYLSIIAIAKFFGVRVMLYANGIGPLNKKNNRRITQRILNRADVITLRDEKSFGVLREIGVDKPEILITADPVFLIEPSEEEKGDKILAEAGVPEGRKCLGISIREWKNLNTGFEKELALSIDYAVREHNLFPVFLVLQPRDRQISENVAQHLKSDYVLLDANMKVSDLLCVVSRCHITIGMRLHMLIYAASCAVPVIGFVYDPKVSGFMDYAGQHYYTEASSIKAEGIISNIDEVMKNHGDISRELTKTKDILCERAKLNGEEAIKLCRRNKKNGQRK